MKWVLIAIGIYAAYLIVRFAIDSAKQSRNMKSRGGVREKYSILINHILAQDPRIKIFQETSTFVSVGISGIAGSQVYYIQQTFSTVTIQMKIKDNPLLGSFSIEWNFPENMNQQEMINKINSDVETKTKSIIEKYQ